jgi:hypothetical protein
MSDTKPEEITVQQEIDVISLVMRILGQRGMARTQAANAILDMQAEGLVVSKPKSEEAAVKVTLVPVEVFGTDPAYGLMDAVSSWSDCNRAIGHIYRRDEEENVPFRNPSDVITVYVPRSELAKFDKKIGD